MKNIFNFTHLRRFSLVCLITIASGNFLSGQPWKEHGRILVSPSNPHYLEHEDVTPFLWLGDTGWELIHRLNREEAEQYLENRRSKDFNVPGVSEELTWLRSGRGCGWVLVIDDASQYFVGPGN